MSTEITEANTQEQPGELERLRAHNAELLGDMKKLRAKFAAQAKELDEARAALHATRVDGPVGEAIAEVAAVSPRIFRSEFERHYKFAAGDDGKVAIQKHDGTPATIQRGDKRVAAMLNAADLRALCAATGEAATFDALLRADNKAGSGAPTNGGGNLRPSKPQEPSPTAPASFGLR